MTTNSKSICAISNNEPPPFKGEFLYIAENDVGLWRCIILNSVYLVEE